MDIVVIIIVKSHNFRIKTNIILTYLRVQQVCVNDSSLDIVQVSVVLQSLKIKCESENSQNRDIDLLCD